MRIFDMAAAFTTTATSLEGQFFELAREIHEAEQAIALENRPNRLTLAYDTEDAEVTITATLPVAMTGTGNQMAFAAVPYLT